MLSNQGPRQHGCDGCLGTHRILPTGAWHPSWEIMHRVLKICLEMKAGRYMIFATATLVRLRAELSITTNSFKTWKHQNKSCKNVIKKCVLLLKSDKKRINYWLFVIGDPSWTFPWSVKGKILLKLTYFVDIPEFSVSRQIIFSLNPRDSEIYFKFHSFIHSNSNKKERLFK